MRSAFSRLAALLLAALMIFSLAACAKKPAAPDNSEERRGDGVPIIKAKSLPISAESCYHDCGYYAFVASKTAEYTLTFDNAGHDIGWKVYLLDSQYKDDLKTLADFYEPVLEGEGTFKVNARQYVYLWCSVNILTADEPAAGAVAVVTGIGVPY